MEKNIYELVELQKKNSYTDTQMGAFLGVCAATYVWWKKGRTTPQSQIMKDKIKEILKSGSRVT